MWPSLFCVVAAADTYQEKKDRFFNHQFVGLVCQGNKSTLKFSSENLLVDFCYGKSYELFGGSRLNGLDSVGDNQGSAQCIVRHPVDQGEMIANSKFHARQESLSASV